MGRPSDNRRNRWACARAALGAAIVSIAIPRVARASAPELVVTDVTGCASSAELRRAIAAQIGHDDFDLPGSPRIVVTIRHAAGAATEPLVSEITLAPANGASSTRTLPGATCADLLRASALTIALALDAEPAPPAPAPAPAPAAAPAALPAPLLAPPGADDSPSSSPARDLRTDRAVIVASAITSVGLLPRPSAGGAATARLRVSESVWLSARGFFLPEARMPNDTFGMTLAAGGAGACLEPFGARSVAALGCAHVVGGSLAAVSPNETLRNGGAKPFGAAILSAGARARVAGPLVLEASLEAAIPFAHPTYLTEVCPESGFQQPFAAVALVLGAGVSIP